MAQTSEAVYENGVLRPKEPMALSEGETVEILVMSRTTRSPAERQAESAAIPPGGRRGPVVPYDPEAVARLKRRGVPDPAEAARRLKPIAARAPKRDVPEDASENHDRYLYGENPA